MLAVVLNCKNITTEQNFDEFPHSLTFLLIKVKKPTF